MTNNKLKLNNDKTEIMFFGTKSSLADVNITSLEVAGTHVHVSDGPVRNLGVLLDNSLSMSSQVNRMVQPACLHLRKNGQIRNKITESSTKSLFQSLVISRLDYSNSLLCRIPIDLVTKLQDGTIGYPDEEARPHNTFTMYAPLATRGRPNQL